MTLTEQRAKNMSGWEKNDPRYKVCPKCKGYGVQISKVKRDYSQCSQCSGSGWKMKEVGMKTAKDKNGTKMFLGAIVKGVAQNFRTEGTYRVVNIRSGGHCGTMVELEAIDYDETVHAWKECLYRADSLEFLGR